MNVAVDLTTEEQHIVQRLLASHLPDTEAWVYGSRVKWTSRPQSDLDLVVFAKSGQERAVSDLREALDESDLPFRVDLFVWDEVPDSFRKQIEREHVVLSESLVGTEKWSRQQFGECIVMNDETYSRKEAWTFVNYLETGGITDNLIVEIQYLNLNNKVKLPTRARRKVQAGDIVFSTVRPNQRHFGFLRDVPENFLASTGFAVFRAREDVADTGFVYRFLTQAGIVDQLHTIAEHSTSAYPSIRPADIKSLDIDLPPLSEQRAIAHILGTLDDKIELNRRMNATLEGMARALFKDWFEDFGPVRAKMEGRDTGLPKEVASLFPDRLVDSEDGEVPYGWSTWSLQQITSHYKQTLSPWFEPDTEFDLFSIPAYDEGENPNRVTGKSIKSNKIIVPPCAVLLSRLNPAISRVWIPERSQELRQICSTEFVAFTARYPATRSLLFAMFTSRQFQEKIESMVTGTSGSHQRIPIHELNSLNVIAGSPQLMTSFDVLVTPIMEQIIDARIESRILAEVRDALLPQLVSGQMRISDST